MYNPNETYEAKNGMYRDMQENWESRFRDQLFEDMTLPNDTQEIQLFQLRILAGLTDEMRDIHQILNCVARLLYDHEKDNS